jgi:putative methyltransferase (TIGR04325 family)
MWDQTDYVNFYQEKIEEKATQFKNETQLVSLKFRLLNRPLLSILKQPLKFGKILDVGGGGGDNYFTFRKRIQNKTIKYFVLDSEVLFDATEDIRKKYSNSNDKLIHLKDLKNISMANVDITLLIGTLQYLSEDDLASLLVDLKQINNIIVARTPIVNQSKELVQIAKVPVGQEVKLQKVQVYLRSKSDMKRVFKKFGFKMQKTGLRLPYFLSTEHGNVLTYYQMIHFYRQK